MDVALTFLIILCGLGTLIDKSLNDQSVKIIKNKIANWWVALSDDSFEVKILINNSIFFFNTLFDSLFGEKHFTFRCLFRSMVTSFFCFLLVLFCIIFIFDVSLPWDLSDYVIILLNFIVDFLSLFQSRIFFKYAARRSFFTIFIMIILDILISLLIYILIFLFFPFKETAGLNVFEALNPYGAYVDDHDDYFLISSLLSTFYTSFLFYAFFASTILFRFLSLMRIPLRSILEWLDSLNNPVTSIVGILGGITLIIKGIQLILT